MEADLDRDGKISFEEFTKMVENTDVSMSMTLGMCMDLLYSTSTLVSGSLMLCGSTGVCVCSSLPLHRPRGAE